MKTKKLLTASLILTFVIVSCNKNPVRPTQTPIDATGLRVKDINERNLPSPYYHFEYDDSGRINLLNYQSGLRVYTVRYSGDNIIGMESATGPTLEYIYVNGEFVGIKVKNRNGEVIENCIVSYNSSHWLQEIEWDVSDGNTGFLIEQTLTYSYYPDGNVMEVVTHN